MSVVLNKLNHVRTDIDFILENGGDRKGYISKYGEEKGREIWNADTCELKRKIDLLLSVL